MKDDITVRINQLAESAPEGAVPAIAELLLRLASDKALDEALQIAQDCMKESSPIELKQRLLRYQAEQLAAELDEIQRQIKDFAA